VNVVVLAHGHSRSDPRRPRGDAWVWTVNALRRRPDGGGEDQPIRRRGFGVDALNRCGCHVGGQAHADGKLGRPVEKSISASGTEQPS